MTWTYLTGILNKLNRIDHLVITDKCYPANVANADNVANVANADNADHADHAAHADHADHVANADHADHADHTDHALFVPCQLLSVIVKLCRPFIRLEQVRSIPC